MERDGLRGEAKSDNLVVMQNRIIRRNVMRIFVLSRACW